MKQGRVTIKDIARELDISTSTVSRALRNHPEIKEATRKAVLELAEKLDYQPNQISLSLLQQRTNTIGVVVPKMGYHFFSEAMEGVDEVALAQGNIVMVCQTNESYEREVQNVRNLAAGRVDGLIVSVSGQTKNYDHFQQLHKRGIPIVFFDRDCEVLNTSKVLVDNEDAAIKVVDHLVEQGCKRIAYLGGPQNLALSNTRLSGYRKGLEKHGIAFEQHYVTYCDFSYEEASKATRQLLEQPNAPDAIFAMSDRLAVAAVQTCKEMGKAVPQDVAIVGFNNEPMVSLIDPPISSVTLPEYEMGHVAAKLLLKEINDEEGKLEPETVVLRTELIVRASSLRK